MDSFELAVFVMVPAIVLLVCAGALLLQSHATRAFDARWETNKPGKTAEHAGQTQGAPHAWGVGGRPSRAS